MTEPITSVYKTMLERYQTQSISMLEFTSWARDWSTQVLQSWPQEQMHSRGAYADLWMDLLDRLESSALFTEESCSFSQADLLLSMGKWVKKVEGFVSLPHLTHITQLNRHPQDPKES